MTNYEYLKLLDAQSIAAFFINTSTVEDYVYDSDVAFSTSHDIYTTSDAHVFEFYDDAYEHEVEWLNSEHEESLADVD